jgi:hypothetical protein
VATIASPARSVSHPAQRRRGQRADDQAGHDPHQQLVNQEPNRVEHAVAGALDHVDHHQHQHHRNRVVEPRFAFQGQGQTPAQSDPAQQREHCRAVGGTEDGAQQQPLGKREMQQPRRGQSGDQRRYRGTDEGQRQGAAQHRAQPADPGLQPALEQDHGQSNGPHQPRQRVVVEVDPAQTVGPDRHPQAQKQHQRRQAQPRCHHRRGDACRQQRAADPDQLCVRGHRL